MKINAFNRLTSSISDGRFEEEQHSIFVIKELTKAFGKPVKELGYRRSDTLEVIYPDYRMVLTNKKVTEALARLSREKYEVQLSRAPNGILVTVLDTLA